MTPKAQTGLDRLAAGDPEIVKLVRGRNVGLLAHPASVDANLVHAATIIAQAGATLSALFGPEHGFSGAAQDMIHVESDTEVYSLYGATEQDLSPKPDWLDGLDTVIIDLQDVGSRYYTYVWTAALMLKQTARLGIDCIVLDRPNPLGGVQVEGAPQREGYRSFVGLYDVAVRHALTIAEVLHWVIAVEGIDDNALSTVSMRGWRREMYFDDTGLPWVMPSPNMPTLDTAIVYPGGCLIEGTRLSEGRGTTRPFEVWGAPGLTPQQWGLHTPGTQLRPLSFTPTFHKHAGDLCAGVQVHVADRARFAPYQTYLRLLAKALAELPQEARWRTEPYEFVSDRPAIDLLTGGPEFREAVDSGAEIMALCQDDAAAAAEFATARQSVLIYR